MHLQAWNKKGFEIFSRLAVTPFALRAIVFLTLSLLTFGCQHVTPVRNINASLYLSTEERCRLERASADGDAAAASRLYIYYSFASNDQTRADQWLRRAAMLQDAEAQRWLAHLIKENKSSSSGFGSSGPEAVKALLEQASRTEGDACFDLASAYAEGYFGATNNAKAREYFERGATFGNRACWKEVSRYCRNGIGGSRSETEAYYWISLEARCVDPRSVSGQEAWAAREQIAERLSIAELQKEWSRIDDYISKVEAKRTTVYSAPFLSGYIDPRLEAEGRKLSMEAEMEHRAKLRQSKS